LETDLSTYNNYWYKPGSRLKRFLWYFINELFLKNRYNPSSSVKLFWLKCFGAKIGNGVVIKPSVNIKYPWKLKIGNHCWIGEEVWIDNLEEVTIGDHVCLSQGAFLICGNHNYKSTAFDLIVKPIHIESGAWIGSKSVVGPGVTVGSHAVLSLGSVASNNLDSYRIYRGNPAIKIKTRNIV
jgi:putative colanic acid biosynthesis acetyltransferase WcaF